MRDGRRRATIGSGGRGRLWIIAAVALVLLVWAGSWILHRWTHVYIDDARIDGEVVTISSRVSGWITELPVIEGDEVKKGQVARPRRRARFGAAPRSAAGAAQGDRKPDGGHARADRPGRSGNARQISERNEPPRRGRSGSRVARSELEAGAPGPRPRRRRVCEEIYFSSRTWSARAPRTSRRRKVIARRRPKSRPCAARSRRPAAAASR